jgi:hypothetical protein
MSQEEYDELEKDLSVVKDLEPVRNAASKKSTIIRGMANGTSYDSFYEFVFDQYFTLVKGYVVERNKTIHFSYFDKTAGKIRQFYPDFLVNGLYYEVKGRVKESDIDKMEQCSHVTFVFGDQIREMRRELDASHKEWASSFVPRP